MDIPIKKQENSDASYPNSHSVLLTYIMVIWKELPPNCMCHHPRKSSVVKKKVLQKTSLNFFFRLIPVKFFQREM